MFSDAIIFTFVKIFQNTVKPHLFEQGKYKHCRLFKLQFKSLYHCTSLTVDNSNPVIRTLVLNQWSHLIIKHVVPIIRTLALKCFDKFRTSLYLKPQYCSKQHFLIKTKFASGNLSPSRSVIDRFFFRLKLFPMKSFNKHVNVKFCILLDDNLTVV